MKSQISALNAELASEAVSKPDIAAEESKTTPSPEGIRRRAFKICIERVGIDCCDLHDWLQAERELQEKYKETAMGTKKSEACS